MNENEKVGLRADYLKTWVTTTLAIIAGEVTLLNTFYKDSSNLWALYLSMLSFMFAIIFCLGAYEALVNKATGVPKVKGKVFEFWLKMLPKTEVSSWVFAAIGAVLIAFGVILAALFILIATA